MGDFSKLAIRIKELRTLLNKTQKEFASHVGCTAATLSAYENGSKSPSLEIVKNIAEKCNVSIDWLCGLSDTMRYDDEIKTYADMFRFIVKLCDTETFFGEWIMVYENNQDFDDMGRTGLPVAILKNYDKTIADFFKDWSQMYALYKSYTIDKHLYDLWIADKLVKYENELLVPSIDDCEPFSIE